MKNITILLLLTIAVLFLQCKKDTDLEPDCEPCPACPVVESISPTTAIAGDIITITGKKFGRFGEGDNDRVEIGGIVTNITGEISDTQLSVEVPTDAIDGEVVVYSASATHLTQRNTLASNEDKCVLQNYPTPVLSIGCREEQEFYIEAESTIYSKLNTRLISGSNVIVVSNNNDELVIFFVDDMGIIQDSITSPSQGSIYRVTATNDGGFLVDGYMNNESRGAVIRKFNSLGIHEWTKFFEGDNIYDIVSVGEDLIIAGNIGGWGSIFMTKLDKYGNTYSFWYDNQGNERLEYEVPEDSTHYLVRAIEPIENGFLMLAYNYYVFDGVEHSIAVLLKIDNNGVLTEIISLKDQLYFLNSGNSTHVRLNMTRIIDGNFLIYGKQKDYDDDIPSFTIVIDTEGNVIEEIKYIDSLVGNIQEVIPNSNGYLIVGSTPEGIVNKASGILVAEMDLDRRTILNKTSFNSYSRSGYSASGSSIHERENGGYFIFGSLQNESETRPYYAILDCL